MRTLLLIGTLLLATMICHAGENDYIWITGLACTQQAGVDGAKNRNGDCLTVHVVGTIIGGGKDSGKQFYDFKALDKTVLRFSWPFDAKLTKGQEITIKGTLPRVGHIDATGLV